LDGFGEFGRGRDRERAGMLEDELLKWKFRRGSREALARIYEKYLDSMLTLAVGLLNNTAEAEDVVHDVFVAFARSAQDFRVRGSLSGYLATSVVNRVRDHRRRRCRQIVNAGKRLEPVREAAPPDEKVIFTEQAGRLNQVVAELPDDQREVVLLRLTASMKFRDIAKLQQTSVNTVQGRYRYGLDKLRSMLNGEVNE
jgi:RNA polymerase sigma-70 factor (ECF subfamily)